MSTTSSTVTSVKSNLLKVVAMGAMSAATLATPAHAQFHGGAEDSFGFNQRQTQTVSLQQQYRGINRLELRDVFRRRQLPANAQISSVSMRSSSRMGRAQVALEVNGLQSGISRTIPSFSSTQFLSPGLRQLAMASNTALKITGAVLVETITVQYITRGGGPGGGGRIMLGQPLNINVQGGYTVDLRSQLGMNHSHRGMRIQNVYLNASSSRVRVGFPIPRPRPVPRPGRGGRDRDQRDRRGAHVNVDVDFNLGRQATAVLLVNGHQVGLPQLIPNYETRLSFPANVLVDRHMSVQIQVRGSAHLSSVSAALAGQRGGHLPRVKTYVVSQSLHPHQGQSLSSLVNMVGRDAMRDVKRITVNATPIGRALSNLQIGRQSQVISRHSSSVVFNLVRSRSANMVQLRSDSLLAVHSITIEFESARGGDFDIF